MRKLVIVIIQFLAFISLCGCSTPLLMKGVPQSGQQVVYKDGQESLVSEMQNVVVVSPSPERFESNKRPTFVVSVLNRGKEALVFSTESIQVTHNKKSLKVLTYAELKEEIESNRNLTAMLTALSGALRSASATGYTYNSGSYSTNYTGNYNTYGNYGSTYGSYSGTGTGYYSGYTYDPAKAEAQRAAIQSETNQQIDNINTNANSALQELKQTILKKETVFPGNWHGGYIKAELLELNEKEDNTVEMTVKLNEELHRFIFTVEKIKQPEVTSDTSE